MGDRVFFTSPVNDLLTFVVTRSELFSWLGGPVLGTAVSTEIVDTGEVTRKRFWRGWSAEPVAAAFIVASLFLWVIFLTLRSLDGDPSRLVAREALALGVAARTSHAETRAVAERILRAHFDLQRACHSMLGPGWLRLEETQRERVVETFRRLLVRSYAGELQRLYFNAMRSLPTSYRDLIGESVVRLRVPLASTESIRLELHFHYDDTWKIYDVALGSVTLVGHYRPLFRSAMESGGVEALIEALDDL